MSLYPAKITVIPKEDSRDWHINMENRISRFGKPYFSQINLQYSLSPIMPLWYCWFCKEFSQSFWKTILLSDNLHTMQFTRFVYNSVIFSIFTELHNYHHGFREFKCRANNWKTGLCDFDPFFTSSKYFQGKIQCWH